MPGCPRPGAPRAACLHARPVPNGPPGSPALPCGGSGSDRWAPVGPKHQRHPERGLVAQARGPTPNPAAPATSTLHFSILRATSGTRLEAETGSRKRPLAPLRPVEPSLQRLEVLGERSESAEVGSHMNKSDFSVQLT